ncbi:hypothetical protein N9N67_11770 [Bacteriovoracaceae bacterium]|nr:hypothetical protein [Bacteriovoracaceae bacterium]
MMYEISREIFKQRLLDRLNFHLINISSKDNFDKVELKKETGHISYGANFVDELQKQVSDKDSNIILFSFNPEDNASLTSAANDAKLSGFNFVYYYQGSKEDNILDKGLN